MKLVLILLATTLYGAASAAEFEDIIYSESGKLCTVASTAGTGIRCLREDFEFGSPAWQPGGHTLVVEAGVHDGLHKLLLLSSSGETIRSLSESSGFSRPAWSSDGKTIYAVSYALGQAVGRWSAEGKNFNSVPVNSSEPFRYVQMLAFSPNGERAALLVDDFKKMLIAQVSNSGFDVERVLPKQFSYVAQAAWLDDTRLLFVGKQDSPHAELWELNTQTGAVKARGINGLWIRDFLALSPDRTTAVVCGSAVGAKQPRWGLWSYSLQNSLLVQLTNGIEDVTPAWRQ
ncbi:hypothetical protein D6779_10160 [Candidatus Parcubacteria bacterium]|nr:MAG: hypothetical protein D6779_10160 [Candidatus Parcubacteria bacterium]